MSINITQRIARKLTTKLLNRRTIKVVKKSSNPSEDLKLKYFHAVARNEMASTTALNDVEYVVYYGEQRAQSHYDMWNPIFAERPNSYISIFRFTASWWPVNEDPNVYPVSAINQIELLFSRMPNLKAVFYPANNGVNMQAVRNNDVTHVFLGHGDSNKASSANKVFRLYDHVWVAGQAHLDRFGRVSGDYSALDFRIIGQPWMREWLINLPAYSIDERTSWGYFPTWRGYYKRTNYSSLDHTKDIISAAQDCLNQDSKGYLKLHPWSTDADVAAVAKQAAKLAVAEKTSVDLVASEESVTDNELIRKPGDVAIFSDSATQKPIITLPNKSVQMRDILKNPLRFVICDVSAAVTECLYINVPIFLYYPGPPALLADDFEEQNSFCYLYRNMKELRDLLKQVITENDDYLSEERVKAMNHFVDIEKTKTGEFYKELDRLPKIKS